MSRSVGPHGRRALLFVNNPFSRDFTDPTEMGIGYDVLTALDPTNYAVPVSRKAVADGDVAVVYRVDAGAQRRDPGRVVAIACITSSPWITRSGWASVNWQLQILPPESWISSKDMKKSGFWTNRVPLSTNTRATSPVELDADQWGWISSRLPETALCRLTKHAQD